MENADKTKKRRAVLAFCMDTLVRALADEDAQEPWLADGTPDGTGDEVPDRALEEAGKPYLDYVGDTTRDEWNDLCSCWAGAMARGCFGWSEAVYNLVYEEGSIS